MSHSPGSLYLNGAGPGECERECDFLLGGRRRLRRRSPLGSPKSLGSPGLSGEAMKAKAEMELETEGERQRGRERRERFSSVSPTAQESRSLSQSRSLPVAG